MADSEEKAVAREDDEGEVEEFEKKGYEDNFETVYQPDTPPSSTDPTTGMGIYSDPPKVKVYKIKKCKGKAEAPSEEDESEDSESSDSEEEKEVDKNSTVFCNGKRVLCSSFACDPPEAEIYDREFELEDNGFIKMKLSSNGHFKVKYVDIYEDVSIKDSNSSNNSSSSSGNSSSGSSGDSGPKIKKAKQLVIDKSGMSSMLGDYVFKDTLTDTDTIENIEIEGGSSKVFVEGRPIARKGDNITGGSLTEGSPNVFAG